MCVCTCMFSVVRVCPVTVHFSVTVCLCEDKEDGGWKGRGRGVVVYQGL